MLKAVPAILFTSLGAAAAGTAVYMQHNPGAFTSPKPVLLDSGAARVAHRAEVVTTGIKPAVEAPVDDVVRGEIVIYARPKAVAASPHHRADKNDLTLRPCSDWRELDPQS